MKKSESGRRKQIVIMAWRDLWHPETGGAERYIYEMAQALVSQNFDVVYLTSQYHGALAEETKDGIRYIRMGNRVTVYPLSILYFLRKLRGQTSLLIESYNFVPYLVPMLHRENLTVIYHIQTVEWGEKLGPLGVPIGATIRAIMPWIYRNQNIVTISPSSQEEILSRGFKPKELKVVYSGINMPVGFRADLSAKSKEIIHLNVTSRLTKTKNVHWAIKLVAEAVKSGFDNLKLDIVGHGDAEQELRKLATELEVADKIEFHGFVTDAKKFELLQEAHLHLQLSLKEGWGITVIEAAACGTPSVTLDVPGLRDSVRPDVGYLMSDRSELFKAFPAILYEVRSGALSYTDRQSKAIDYAKNFTWSSQSSRFVEFVKTLIR